MEQDRVRGGSERERERTSERQRGGRLEDFGRGLHANKDTHRSRGVRGSKEYLSNGDGAKFDPQEILGRSQGPTVR